MFKNTITKSNFVKISTIIVSIVTFTISTNFSYSQQINQGELLNEKTLEIAISNNSKNGIDLYSNLYSNYTIVIELSQVKVDAQAIINSAKSITGVLDCKFDSNSGQLVVVTKKMRNNPFEDQIKQNIDLLGYVQLSITELIYKN